MAVLGERVCSCASGLRDSFSALRRRFYCVRDGTLNSILRPEIAIRTGIHPTIVEGGAVPPHLGTSSVAGEYARSEGKSGIDTSGCLTSIQRPMQLEIDAGGGGGDKKARRRLKRFLCK